MPIEKESIYYDRVEVQVSIPRVTWKRWFVDRWVIVMNESARWVFILKKIESCGSPPMLRHEVSFERAHACMSRRITFLGSFWDSGRFYNQSQLRKIQESSLRSMRILRVRDCFSISPSRYQVSYPRRHHHRRRCHGLQDSQSLYFLSRFDKGKLDISVDGERLHDVEDDISENW